MLAKALPAWTGMEGMSVAWRRSLAALAIAAIGLLLIFRRDVGDLLHLWWTSTTFGHCLFIPPVLAWLVWQRRHDLEQLSPAAWWPGLALVAVGGFGWLLGDAAGVAFARQLGLVVMLQGAVVTTLGPKVARGLLFPLAYMIFLVPFGEELEGPLQTITAEITIRLLHLAQVPATMDGVLITIPNGYFEVAEACSGAKFVIAMIAYGSLVAHVCYRSWARRAAFMAMALVVPVLANGLRAFGTVYAAWWSSVEAATGYDHIVYGWLFFGLVMAAVLAIGWRWFDRDPDAPWFDPAALQGAPARRVDLAPAVALVLAVAACFTAWSGAIAVRSDRLPARIALPEVAGWRWVPMSATHWSPNYPGADHFLIGRYVDHSGVPVDLAVAVYAAQHEGKELVGFGQGAIRENDRWVRIEDLDPVDGGATLRMVAPGPIERVVTTWYRVGGITTAGPAVVKLATLKARLLGGRQAGVAVLASAETARTEQGRAAIARFMTAAGGVEQVADRAARTIN